MNVLDRLLEHDAWTTEQFLRVCGELSDESLDRKFDMGHRTIRATLDHILHNMEVWSAMMDEQPWERSTDKSVTGMLERLAAAERKLGRIARRIAASGAWDATYLDFIDDPPQPKRFGTTIAHLITHSMHHRAQVLYMLRRVGAPDLPEGDMFSWEAAIRGKPE